MSRTNGQGVARIVSDALGVAAGVPAALQGFVVGGHVLGGVIGGTLKNVFGPQQNQMPYWLLPDDYPMTSSTTANAVVQSNARIPTGFDFLWTKVHVKEATTNVYGYSTNFDWKLNFMINGDRLLSSQRNGVIGWAWSDLEARPFMFDKPLRLARGTLIAVLLQSLNTTARYVYVALGGIAVLDYNLMDLTGASQA